MQLHAACMHHITDHRSDHRSQIQIQIQIQIGGSTLSSSNLQLATTNYQMRISPRGAGTTKILVVPQLQSQVVAQLVKEELVFFHRLHTQHTVG